MSAVLAPNRYSAQEYLELERRAEFKSEFHDGQIFAMTGVSREHNLITVNIAAELRQQLKNRPCEAFVNDMRVRAGKAKGYHYPDLAVACGTPQFEDEHGDTLTNPTVLIEVLSPSTEAYDRGGKFANYRKIASLREYLLVAQDQAHIDHYLRQGDAWLLTEAEGLDSSVTLDSIGCILALQEVYDKVLGEA